MLSDYSSWKRVVGGGYGGNLGEREYLGEGAGFLYGLFAFLLLKPNVNGKGFSV